MGTPGKVVRQLDEAAINNLRSSALSYQNNMRRFRDGLQVV
jgi:carbonic anhydrase/acetyltransferase-like protein (isoleucine patch superfamily)